MDMFESEENHDQFNFNTDKQSDRANDLYGRARVSFIQKVYLILTIQIAITVLFTAFSMNVQAFFQFQINNTWLFYLLLIVAVAVQIYMFCCRGGRVFPGNLACLGVFTLAESYLVSFICSATGQSSGNEVVLLAAAYTLVIVAACLLYATFTKSDFTTAYGILYVISGALSILCFMTFFTHFPFIENLYCCAGAIVFGIYLIIDTQMIMGGRSVQLTVDDYALAAMLIYIDIIQIFLYILRLLSKKD